MTRNAQGRQAVWLSIWHPWRQLRQRMCDLLPRTDHGGWTRFHQAWCLDVASGGYFTALDQSFPYSDEEPQTNRSTKYR